jgi:hypothetical protein
MTFSAGAADDESFTIFGGKIRPGYRVWKLLSVHPLRTLKAEMESRERISIAVRLGRPYQPVLFAARRQFDRTVPGVS